MESLTEKRARLRDELDSLKNQYQRDRDEGVLERMNRVKTGLTSVEREIVREAAENPRSREAGTAPPAARSRRGPHSEDREAGLRAIERMADDLSAEAADRLDDVVRRDRKGTESRYLDAVSNPDYESAYFKRLINPEGAQHEYTAEEAEAVRVTAQAASERALGLATGAAGQFAVPASLDPTIALTSDGRINPVRELASVVTVLTDRYQGVNSQGVVANWYQEGTEVSDDSPELSQPEIIPERMSIWVPFSFELGDDWSGLRTEMQTLFADAKDHLEGSAFTLGAGHGSFEPQGLITGGTLQVNGSTAGSAQPANYYALQEALPPRYQPRATFLSTNTQQNHAYRSVAQADTSEPRFVSEDRMSILGKPWRETSQMATGGTIAGTVVAYGDIGRAYTVVDRIGATTEVVPHLFGSNRRPTGQRGLFFWARVGGEVRDPNAVRCLVTS